MESEDISKLEPVKLSDLHLMVTLAIENIRDEIINTLKNIIPIEQKMTTVDNHTFHDILIEEYKDQLTYIDYDTFKEKLDLQERLQTELEWRINAMLHNKELANIIHHFGEFIEEDIDVGNFKAFYDILTFAQKKSDLTEVMKFLSHYGSNVDSEKIINILNAIHPEKEYELINLN